MTSPKPRTRKRERGPSSPAVTADVVIFTMRAGDLAVLLVRRKTPPFAGWWALPGGFVQNNESLEHAAARLLYEETGLENVALEQLGAFGEPGRDPRGHTVSVVYYTFAVAESRPPRDGETAGEAAWHPLRSLATLDLAFDHARIVAASRRRLQERLVDPTRASRFELVPPHFTLTELQRVYEAVLGAPLDKRNFRARLLKSGMVESLATLRTGRHRPAQLYRWRQQPAASTSTSAQAAGASATPATAPRRRSDAATSPRGASGRSRTHRRVTV